MAAIRKKWKLTRVRREQALDGFRKRGSNHAAAQSARVDPMTIAAWRRDVPDFEEDVLRAIDECDERIAALAPLAIEKHLNGYIRGEPVVKRRQQVVDGEAVTLDFEEPPELNPSVAKLAATRRDKRWTHPEQGAGTTVQVGGGAQRVIVELVRPGEAEPDGETPPGSA